MIWIRACHRRMPQYWSRIGNGTAPPLWRGPASVGPMKRRQALLAALKQGSIVLWHHLNLHGEYDFSEEKLQDSVGWNLSRILAVDVP